MKKLTSLFLALALVVGLAIPVLAADVVPTPPSWVTAAEYPIFEGSAAYLPENWAIIKALRAYAEDPTHLISSDNPQYRDDLHPKELSLVKRAEETRDSGLLFELGLIEYKLYVNLGEWTWWPKGENYFRHAAEYLDSKDENGYLAWLWSARANGANGLDSHYLYQAMTYLVGSDRFTIDQLLSAEIFQSAPAEQIAQFRKELFVVVDDVMICPKTMSTTEKGTAPKARVQNGCTLLPLRLFGEAMGAEVVWKQAEQKIILTRASHEAALWIGKTRGELDGVPLELDVPPYAEGGTTYVPLRFLGEFFGQKVEWDGTRQAVLVYEDLEPVGKSNLESWALPMGAMLEYKNRQHPQRFGGLARAEEVHGFVGRTEGFISESARDHSRRRLTESWSIESRESLISTIQSMSFHGHNDSFLEAAADADSLTDVQFKELIAQSSATDRYMWPYTKHLSEKWGDRGIVCWDLFRMSNLVQWGYLAGYVTYPEALALLEPAAKLLYAQFTSWDEAYENYLDGYSWWARENVLGQDIWETERGVLYTEMKSDPTIVGIFDNALFQTGVISVPNITAEALLKSVNAATNR